MEGDEPMRLFAMIAVLTIGTMGSALAQEAAGGAGETYKAKTVYDFEDDKVEGDLQRPDGELVNSINKAKHASLIEIRKDFIPEMLKSLEDI
jgi:hypothetical protein